jgi:hypothetical protein
MLGADVARCHGKDCPLRDKCLRFVTPPVPNHPRQDYVVSPYDKSTGECVDFWEVAKVEKTNITQKGTKHVL